MEIESIQKRALRIIHPDSSYIEALKKSKLETLYDRREKLCVKLFSSIEANNDHKLKELYCHRKIHYQLISEQTENIIFPRCTRADLVIPLFYIAHVMQP